MSRGDDNWEEQMRNQSAAKFGALYSRGNTSMHHYLFGATENERKL